MRVRVTLDRLARWGQRDRLSAGQRVGLPDVEDGHSPKDRAPLLPVLPGGVSPGLLALTVAQAHRGEDADRTLALAHAPVQLKKGSKARDVACVGSLHRD